MRGRGRCVHQGRIRTVSPHIFGEEEERVPFPDYEPTPLVGVVAVGAHPPLVHTAVPSAQPPPGLSAKLMTVMSWSDWLLNASRALSVPADWMFRLASMDNCASAEEHFWSESQEAIVFMVIEELEVHGSGTTLRSPLGLITAVSSSSLAVDMDVGSNSSRKSVKDLAVEYEKKIGATAPP